MSDLFALGFSGLIFADPSAFSAIGVKALETDLFSSVPNINEPSADDVPVYATASEALRDVFGYESFRSPQDEIIDTLIGGDDAMVIMPTGGGKSLCYQIPALIREGCGLVVSPLIALMQDQVTALKQAGVRAAC